MAVTIKDVAKLANVAPSTVSRVIANNPRISEQTKRKVREAMEYLGYHPNFNARSLANRSSKAIGIVMPSSAEKAFQNPFFPEVLRGISTKAHEKEFTLLMSTGTTEEEIYRAVVGMVQGRRVDGIVLLYSRVDDPVMAYLYEQKFPFMVVGKPYKDDNKISHVDNDNFKASRQLTDHLISNGHERIGFVGGSVNLVVTTDRLLGYEKALQVARIPYRSEYIINTDFALESGKQAVSELMSLSEPPTALVVTDDLMALGVLRMFNDMGVKVPKDVSVTSFNNAMIAELATPSLTSVDINIYELGYQAVDNLLKSIDKPDRPPSKIKVGHRIIIRQSSEQPLRTNV
ncbi:LacI family DNA-binding transcriptional regulator [Pseudalkalibacillus decolorationis]|uniref:LacI family DNA-binding transcriptional regulator n=1 Tax=Pseudalkalibacillus decolorationis TaxID=163879 RepID=UPI0021472B5C|nr:LacI family DNA-binding transcriptional regulator [Pseudalkalibacillus decolorationis]